MTRRAATYTRVSSAEQVENTSLENQAGKLAALADQMGLTLVRQYTDPGHSGAKRDRPALVQMLADARAGLFDVVLIYRLDRLARSTYLAYSLIQELADAGVGVRSYSEPQIDSTTPMGKVSLGVTAIFAELERDTFMQRSADGVRKAVEQGHYGGGITPYGYTVENKRLTIFEPEAEVVRLVFGWSAERGWSTVRIAEELTRLNIPTRYRTPGRGVRGRNGAVFWRAGGVLRILKNAVYRGEYTYGKRNTKGKSGIRGVTTHPAPAIVTPQQWTAAQETLSRNTLIAMRNARHVYMLRSLIKCGTCGRTYIGTNSRAWRGYYCGGRYLRGGTPEAHKCQNPTLNGPAIEGEVWARIRAILTDPAHAFEQAPLSLIPAELPHVEKALASTEATRTRLTDLYLDPNADMSKADYLSRVAALDAQAATLRARLAELRDHEAQTAARAEQERRIHDLAHQYRDRLADADDLTRQTLAHHLVRRITVQADGSADVEYAV